jgi:hypothetical protein
MCHRIKRLLVLPSSFFTLGIPCIGYGTEQAFAGPGDPSRSG